MAVISTVREICLSYDMSSCDATDEEGIWVYKGQRGPAKGITKAEGADVSTAAAKACSV